MSYSRQERLAQIQLLQQGNLTHREISQQLGISLSQVRNILYDPDGHKQHERRKRYQGTCRVCGQPTDGSNGSSKAPRICAACNKQQQHDNRHWTPERIIEAIHQYANEHGHRPVSHDWLRQGENKGRYPNVAVMIKEFGSFANAIEAAGYERPQVGQYFLGDRQTQKGRYRVPTETLIQRIRDHSDENGVAPAAHTGQLKGTYQMLLKRGIRWRQACAMAEVTPRLKRGWEKRVATSNQAA